MKSLTKTDFNFEGQKAVYHGKVRDVYTLDNGLLVMVATDRISAFDVILPKGIPFKGQILNQIAAKFLDETKDICPNWKLATPDPNVTVGVACKGFPVEMIVRGYLCGSAWRAYKSGVREICGVKLPEGMKENQKFPEPIITPTTKAEIGEHDQDISKEEIIAQGLVSAEDYAVLEKYTIALFKRGTEIAASKGLILVDTKYEFGKNGDKIYLMDEIYQNKLTNEASGNIIIQRGYKDAYITCDSAEPKSVADYRAMGLPAKAAVKGPGSVDYGMKWLQRRKIVIDRRRTPNAYNEFVNYEYERNKDGDIISGYPDANNHLIDATRYALERISRQMGVIA